MARNQLAAVTLFALAFGANSVCAASGGTRVGSCPEVDASTLLQTRQAQPELKPSQKIFDLIMQANDAKGTNLREISDAVFQLIVVDFHGAENKLWIDLKRGKCEAAEHVADVTITMAEADFVALSMGTLDYVSAYNEGKMHIAGESKLGAKLSLILEFVRKWAQGFEKTFKLIEKWAQEFEKTFKLIENADAQQRRGLSSDQGSGIGNGRGQWGIHQIHQRPGEAITGALRLNERPGEVSVEDFGSQAGIINQGRGFHHDDHLPTHM